MQQDSYDTVATTETYQDDCDVWSDAVDGFKLFRRDRQERRSVGLALYIKDCFDCDVECLWVRMRGKANDTHILFEVCYRPP